MELKLEVTNKHNVLERCFYLFSLYDKTSEYDDESGANKLSMDYFMYNEEEIVTNILYLGKFVKIIEPSYLRDKLLNRIMKALILYK